MTDNYGMQATLDISYEQAIVKVTEELKKEGFGVLTEIDVKSTMKKKIDKDFRRYIILGACNPNLAYQALQAELEIGLMLPCNVIVYEADAGSVVSIVDPIAMLGIGVSENLKPVADEARARLQRVVANLGEG